MHAHKHIYLYMHTLAERERFMGLPRMLTRVHEFPGVMDRPWQSNTPNMPKLGINSSNKDTPNVKKRHRRAKSGGVKNVDQGAGDGRKPTLVYNCVSLSHLLAYYQQILCV